MEYGSSTHHPEQKGGQSTNDVRLWVKWGDGEWFTPYGHFSKMQICKMLEVCRNEFQAEALMRMLAAREEDEV